MFGFGFGFTHPNPEPNPRPNPNPHPHPHPNPNPDQTTGRAARHERQHLLTSRCRDAAPPTAHAPRHGATPAGRGKACGEAGHLAGEEPRRHAGRRDAGAPCRPLAGKVRVRLRVRARVKVRVRVMVHPNPNPNTLTLTLTQWPERRQLAERWRLHLARQGGDLGESREIYGRQTGDIRACTLPGIASAWLGSGLGFGLRLGFITRTRALSRHRGGRATARGEATRWLVTSEMTP